MVVTLILYLLVIFLTVEGLHGPMHHQAVVLIGSQYVRHLQVAFSQLVTHAEGFILLIIGYLLCYVLGVGESLCSVLRIKPVKAPAQAGAHQQ